MSQAVDTSVTPDEKFTATLVAKAALAGFELVKMADGSFVISRWGLLRPLEGLAAVNAFLVSVGAA